MCLQRGEKEEEMEEEGERGMKGRGDGRWRRRRNKYDNQHSWVEGGERQGG